MKIEEIKRLSKIAAKHPFKVIKAIIVLISDGPRVVAQKIKRQDILEDYNAYINTQYLSWVKKNYPTSFKLKKERETKFRISPKISIVTPAFNTPEKFLRECIESVIKQSYQNWELCLADDASSDSRVRAIIGEFAKKDNRIKYFFRNTNGHISAASNSALELASGEFIALLDHDDLLWPNALHEVIKAVNENPKANFIYSDEDKVEENSKFHLEPFFKPDFSPNYLKSVNYIAHFTVIRRSFVKSAGGFREGYEGAQDWDLFLRVIRELEKKAKIKTIVHIPKILYSWRKTKASAANEDAAKSIKKYAFSNQKKVLVDDLKSGELSAKVLPTQNLGLWRIKYEIKDLPLVSIIIPTKESFKYISRCLESILTKTTYKNYQIILVDTGSKDEKIWKLYEAIKKRHRETIVLKWQQPFNFSSVCNFGAKLSKGEYLLFLNNDTQVLTSDWIESMLELAQLKQVGAVGCKLLFPNRRLQHAGVVLGIAGGLVKKGVAAHPFKNFYNRKINPGYAKVVDAIRDTSAVTGACLLISRKRFDKVGGFDPKFRVAFNDVDFCLKCLRQNWFNVYTPYAVLKHWESVSVGLPGQKGRLIKEFLNEVKLMYQKWGNILQNDPFYNKNLTLRSEDYTLNI